MNSVMMYFTAITTKYYKVLWSNRNGFNKKLSDMLKPRIWGLIIRSFGFIGMLRDYEQRNDITDLYFRLINLTAS